MQRSLRTMALPAAGVLWRRAPAVAAGARGMQSGSDDRVIGPNAFDRIVRHYNFEGNLSRHMNPEIEKTVMSFEASQNLNKLMPQEWVKWEDSARSALTITTLRYANYVGSREFDQKLTRKVELSFKPDELGLSAGAVEKLKHVVGRRYIAKGNVVKLTAREMGSSAQNAERIVKQVAQLMYYSEILAKESTEEAEEPKASATA
mmetsp:Transcript_26502/g.60446  ORF Transcript_26502/g.60446 Transcript_26502/m.60446 type:complete len:204 (-) Transcript_26502:193-804(-)